MSLTLGAAAAIGGASLLSGIASGLFGKSSTDSANATNVLLARESNALQADMFNRNYAQTEKWNERAYEEYWKQREYDSIANQRARYEAAGINPYFALGDMSAGMSAGSTPTPVGGNNTAPTPVTPTVQPYDFSSSFGMASQGISNALNAYFANSRIESETNLNLLKQVTWIDEKISEIHERLSNAKLSDAQRHHYNEQLEALREQRPYLLSNLRKQGVLLDKQGQSVNEDILLKKQLQDINMLNFDWTQKFNEKQLKIMHATLSDVLSHVDLNNANAYMYVKQAFKIAAEKAGIDQNNYILKQTSDFVINQMKNASSKSGAGLGLLEGKYNPLGLVMQLLSGLFAGAAGVAIKK